MLVSVNRVMRRSVRLIGKRMIPALRKRPLAFLPRDLLERIDEQKVIFVHVPKTAGISVSNMLYGRSYFHRAAAEIAVFHPHRFARLFKFAIVREPIDRFLSAYDYLRKGGGHERDAAFSRNYLAPFNHVNAFVDAWRDAAFREAVTSFIHFRTQVFYVGFAGRCMVNRLVRFDHLADDVAEILGRPVEIPVKNSAGTDRTRRSDLSAKTLATLHDQYAPDFLLRSMAYEQRGDLFGQKLSSS